MEVGFSINNPVFSFPPTYKLLYSAHLPDKAHLTGKMLMVFSENP